MIKPVLVIQLESDNNNEECNQRRLIVLFNIFIATIYCSF